MLRTWVTTERGGRYRRGWLRCRRCWTDQLIWPSHPSLHEPDKAPVKPLTAPEPRTDDLIGHNTRFQPKSPTPSYLAALTPQRQPERHLLRGNQGLTECTEGPWRRGCLTRLSAASMIPASISMSAELVSSSDFDHIFSRVDKRPYRLSGCRPPLGLAVTTPHAFWRKLCFASQVACEERRRQSHQRECGQFGCPI